MISPRTVQYLPGIRSMKLKRLLALLICRNKNNDPEEYSSIIPVLFLYYSCIIPVIFLYYSCIIPVFFLYYSCIIPVFFLYYSCVIPVLFLRDSCIIPVLSVSGNHTEIDLGRDDSTVRLVKVRKGVLKVYLKLNQKWVGLNCVIRISLTK